MLAFKNGYLQSTLNGIALGFGCMIMGIPSTGIVMRVAWMADLLREINTWKKEGVQCRALVSVALDSRLFLLVFAA
jgi:hypothetical protein